jgi:hypothetical protein
MNDQPNPQSRAAVLWTRAQWHRAQSRDFLNNSAASMSQHERAAEALEAQAAQLINEEPTT